MSLGSQFGITSPVVQWPKKHLHIYQLCFCSPLNIFFLGGGTEGEREEREGSTSSV